MRQLVKIGHRGIWKMKNIVSLWLNRIPEKTTFRYSSIKYLLFDGTYFKHENCLMAIMDHTHGTIVHHSYCVRENYEHAHAIFSELKTFGVLPKAITIDGNTSVIRAIRNVWPQVIVQRCLAHIQRQGLSWLRRNPKLQAGRDLRTILLSVTDIKDTKDAEVFKNAFLHWEKKHGELVCCLPSDKVVSDLRATRSLLMNALPDMFHYLDDRHIPATTNRIEGYFSRLKIIYRQHRGLSKLHRKNFFGWYIYFKN